jgi:hypothetical protein
LGPLLFLTYIDDLPEHTQSDARLFADDNLLFWKIIKTAGTEQLRIPVITSGLTIGTVVDGIPSTEMHCNLCLRQEAANKVT